MNSTESITISRRGSNPWGRFLISCLLVVGICYQIYIGLQTGFNSTTGEPLPVAKDAWIFSSLSALFAFCLIYLVSFDITGIAAEAKHESVQFTVFNAPFGNFAFTIPVSKIQKICIATIDKGSDGQDSWPYLDIHGLGRIALPKWSSSEMHELALFCGFSTIVTEDTYDGKTLSYWRLRRLIGESRHGWVVGK